MIALSSFVLSLSVIVTVVATPAVKPLAVPVQFVKTPEAGVPKAGVTNVGLVAKTKEPEPVSSLITPLNCAEVVAEKTLRLFVV